MTAGSIDYIGERLAARCLRMFANSIGAALSGWVLLAA